jgi:hypothetical protein
LAVTLALVHHFNQEQGSGDRSRAARHWLTLASRLDPAPKVRALASQGLTGARPQFEATGQGAAWIERPIDTSGPDVGLVIDGIWSVPLFGHDTALLPLVGVRAGSLRVRLAPSVRVKDDTRTAAGTPGAVRPNVQKPEMDPSRGKQEDRPKHQP